MSRSQRNAPRKVRVRQCPCGAKLRRRLPFGPHPRSAAMLVLIQVSSIKTSRLGSRPDCQDRQRCRRCATSARARSRANSVFLNRNPSRRRNCHTVSWDSFTRDIDRGSGKSSRAKKRPKRVPSTKPAAPDATTGEKPSRQRQGRAHSQAVGPQLLTAVSLPP